MICYGFDESLLLFKYYYTELNLIHFQHHLNTILEKLISLMEKNPSDVMFESSH